MNVNKAKKIRVRFPNIVSGKMVVGTETYIVNEGSIILIPDGDFHKVWNEGDEDLNFVCVFDGGRNH